MNSNSLYPALKSERAKDGFHILQPSECIGLRIRRRFGTSAAEESVTTDANYGRRYITEVFDYYATSIGFRVQ